ncbi:MAG: ABC-type uncharacterized transport system permease subunit [Acidimicrobiales bacterium]|jgi:ABC-type uncharacterized transport system permease subunit
MSGQGVSQERSSKDGSTGDGVFERFGALPAWARWPAMVSMAILVLAIVQGVSGTELLTSGNTSGAMLRWAMPIMLAGLGGLFSERAGIVNIGLEGMMILGTWFGAWGAMNWGPWGGLIAGTVGGALGGLLHAVATVNFGVDQIVSGVAINVMAPALTRFMSERVFGGEVGGSVSQSPRVTGLPSFTVPVLAGGGGGPDILGSIADANIFWISDIASLLHGVMTQIGVFTVLALAMVPLTAWVLARTRMGLRIKICGENPKAGESLGINIYLHKYIGVMISGALAGMAGAYIVLELTGVYRGGQTTGRGFIGLAALIFGNWKALGVLAGSLLFGYPFGLSLIDFDATSSGGATRSLLLVIAIALAGVAVWAYRADKRLDVGLAVILSGIALVWYLLTDTAAAWLPNTMPYALVLIVLVFASQRLRPPATAGVPFRKGET